MIKDFLGNIDKRSAARMIVLVLAWVNSFLVQHGYKTIPVLDQDQVSFAITFIVSVYTAVKHNFLMKKAVDTQTPSK